MFSGYCSRAVVFFENVVQCVKAASEKRCAEERLMAIFPKGETAHTGGEFPPLAWLLCRLINAQIKESSRHG